MVYEVNHVCCYGKIISYQLPGFNMIVIVKEVFMVVFVR